MEANLKFKKEFKILRTDVDEINLVNNPESVDYFNVRTTPLSQRIKDLVAQLEEGEITVPSLQRSDDAWDERKKVLFIDSILRNFPIPPIMLLDFSQKKMIIDGQQRLSAILSYKNDAFSLNDTTGDWNGKKYSELHDNLKYRFDNYVMQIQLVEQINPTPDQGSIAFEIFRRINSSSTPLTKMEIRNAAFYSEYSLYLQQLAKKVSEEKIEIFNRGTINDNAEAILRSIALFIALYSNESNLIDEMSDIAIQTNKTINFEKTMDAVMEQGAKTPGLLKEVTESMFTIVVGTAKEVGVENFYSRSQTKYTKRIQETMVDAIACAVALSADGINVGEWKKTREKIDYKIELEGYDFYKNLFQVNTGSKTKIKERFVFLNSPLQNEKTK